MFNFKKVLAVTLAAATAFTFAPVANLGSLVSAHAAGTAASAGNQDYLSAVSGEMTYNSSSQPTRTFNIVNDLDDGAKVTVTSSNPGVVTVTGDSSTAGASDDVEKGNSVVLTAAGLGSSSITFNRKSDGQLLKTITLTVVSPSSDPVVGGSTTDASTGKTTYDGKITNNNVTTADFTSATTLETGTAADGTQWTLVSVASSDQSVIETSVDGSATAATKIQVKKAGDTTLTVKATADTASGPANNGTTKGSAYDNGKTYPFTYKLTVKSTESVFKIGSTEKSASTYSDITDGQEDYVAEISKSNSVATVDVTLDNAQSGEKIVAYALDTLPSSSSSAPSKNDSKLITVSYSNNKLTITGLAPAFEGGAQTAWVYVSNSLSSGLKYGYIKVTATPDAKTYSTITASVNGGTEQTVKADANNNDATGSIDLSLSTADRTSAPYTATSSPAYTISSNNTSVATVDDTTKTIKAVGTGSAQIILSAKSDATHYGNAELTIKVTVVSQKLDVKIQADPASVKLNKVTTSQKINASLVATPAVSQQPTLTYALATKNADDSYTEIGTSNSDIEVSSDGTVTYKSTAEGTVYVKISTVATSEYAKPADLYVPVDYTQKKEDAVLDVTTKVLSLNVGESGQIAVAVSAGAITYTSSDESVATVSSNGAVTAVAPGAANITVTDAGTDAVAGATRDVVVYVKGASDNVVDNVTTPEKVTGVKVTNKKGARVTVTWDAQDQANIKYYVKKTVNGKSAGKSVNGTKTTLSVKKGATVKVKVKAYIYDSTGKKLVGSYSTTVTKKTDKK